MDSWSGRRESRPVENPLKEFHFFPPPLGITGREGVV